MLSLGYEGYFYKNLFSSGSSYKHYGEIATNAKFSQTSNCANTLYRCLQLSINPIGDPEMPIFTDLPSRFSNAAITYDGSNFTISTGVDSCRICRGRTTILTDVDSASFSSIGSGSTVCVTHPGYLPRVYEFCNYIQNSTVTWPSDFVGTDISVGSSVDADNDSGAVVFSEGSTTIHANSVVIEGETVVEPDAELIISSL